MVDRQLRRRGIWDERVLWAMSTVPREQFVPKDLRSRAYDDHAMGIGLGQTISQPYIVALMTQHLLGPLAGPPEQESKLGRVLEVGGGSGYQAAVLSHLAREVVTIERVPELARRARKDLAAAGYPSVEVLEGDGTLGAPSKGPFDGILVAAAAPAAPAPLVDQLRPGARLIIPIGSRTLQELCIIERTDSGTRETPMEKCMFVPLLGAHGWGP